MLINFATDSFQIHRPIIKGIGPVALFVSPERVRKETMKSIFLYVVYVLCVSGILVKVSFHECHLKGTASIQCKQN